MRAALFDLDETLMPDYDAFLAAVDDVAAALGAPAGMGRVLHERARPRWGQAPAATRDMCDMSSWEALWAPFSAETQVWADGYRLGAWREALADHDVEDAELAARLAAAYREHRLARCRPYPETVAALDALQGRVRLAVVTNGMDDHQLAKLDACGLTGRFDAIVTSQAVAASKPDPRIFRSALEQLGCRADAAVMVGDNPRRDVAGAQQAGLRAVVGRPRRRRRPRRRAGRPHHGSGRACGARVVVGETASAAVRAVRQDRRMENVDLWTDGACAGNPGPGGWAAILVAAGHTRELSGGAPHTTNNRQELTACIEGLRALTRRCAVTIQPTRPTPVRVREALAGRLETARLEDERRQAGRKPRPVGPARSRRRGA